MVTAGGEELVGKAWEAPSPSPHFSESPFGGRRSWKTPQTVLKEDRKLCESENIFHAEGKEGCARDTLPGEEGAGLELAHPGEPPMESCPC